MELGLPGNFIAGVQDPRLRDELKKLAVGDHSCSVHVVFVVI
jgi:hypothetical protein